MVNGNEILRRLKAESGLEMGRSADFEVLSQSIADRTGERLSVNTLKRLFGFNIPRTVPRGSTMDIVAVYLGYADYDSLVKDLGEESDISLFTPVDCLEVAELEKGTQVRVAYEPNRVLILSYLGDFRFLVSEVEGSRNLRKDDVLTITQLAVGHRLVVTQVVRDGINLGAYESAKFRGLKSVEVVG